MENNIVDELRSVHWFNVTKDNDILEYVVADVIEKQEKTIKCLKEENERLQIEMEVIESQISEESCLYSEIIRLKNEINRIKGDRY